MYTGVVAEDMQRNKTKSQLSVYAVLNDDEDERTDKYEAEWNGFWQFTNMMQFLGRFTFVSLTGMKLMVYGILPSEDDTPPVQPLDPSSVAWQGTLEQIIDDATLYFANKCIELQIPAPTAVGFELIGENDDVIAEAELAWESIKVAYLTPDQLGSKDAFISDGWKVVLSDDSEDLISFFQGG